MLLIVSRYHLILKQLALSELKLHKVVQQLEKKLF